MTTQVQATETSGVSQQATRTRTGGSVALDQWRGLALVLVLISHGFYFTHHVAGAGRIGVNLFFFISGILVFRSLNSARGSDWQLVRTFWWRRFRRLYPALVAYLVILFVLITVCNSLNHYVPNTEAGTYFRMLPAVLTYTVNYAHEVPLMMGHLWSLSVEVQFYFLAPVIYLLGRGRPNRQRWIFGAILLALATYGFLRPLRTANLDAIRYHFETAAWPMMLGFWCEFSKRWLARLWTGAVKPLYLAGVVALPMALVVMIVVPDTKLLVIAIGTFLLVPCFLAYSFDIPFPGVGGTALAWLGERTYSIYLLQQPQSIAGFLPTPLQPVGALAAILTGAWSFALFERPFLSTSRVKQLDASSQAGAMEAKQPDLLKA